MNHHTLGDYLLKMPFSFGAIFLPSLSNLNITPYLSSPSTKSSNRIANSVFATTFRLADILPTISAPETSYQMYYNFHQSAYATIPGSIKHQGGLQGAMGRLNQGRFPGAMGGPRTGPPWVSPMDAPMMSGTLPAPGYNQGRSDSAPLGRGGYGGPMAGLVGGPSGMIPQFSRGSSSTSRRFLWQFTTYDEPRWI